MGRKRLPGLYLRGGVWHIDKRVRGSRLCESTGTGDLTEAEAYLARRLEESRQARVFGVRPHRTFRQAATRYLNEATKASLQDDALHLKALDPFIGDLRLDQVHMGSVQAFIAHRRRQGVKTRTINHALQVVRHILNLAAGEWLDEHGLTWLQTAPRIKFLREDDRRAPYPLSWDEQTQLLEASPPHLARMILFKVNTGCREQEVCSLRWEWEVKVPELDTSVFLIPASEVKHREERLVVLNRVAKSVVDEMRDVHDEFVFAYKGGRVQKRTSSAWRRARQKAGLPRRCACTISSKRSGVACVRRRVVRESAGPARPPRGTDQDALLGGGVGPPHRGRKSGVCGEVPQKSRTGDAETTSGQRVMR